MRLMLVLLIMFTGAFIASGAPETKTVGPYNVSFDMNTTTNYSILYAKPVETPASSTYMFMIKTNNTTLANVAVIESKNLSDSTLSFGKLLAERGLISNGFSRNISSFNTEIDGKRGFIYTGLNSKKMRLFMMGYWLDSQDCDCGPVSVGKTKVEVISSYPPALTWNLLSSLHIEKSKLKRQQKTLVFAPPK
jgi:hypothetical protein